MLALILGVMPHLRPVLAAARASEDTDYIQSVVISHVLSSKFLGLSLGLHTFILNMVDVIGCFVARHVAAFVTRGRRRHYISIYTDNFVPS